jgi:CRP/FNR family transcriptional regulator, cyclic AMP receptor protein
MILAGPPTRAFAKARTGSRASGAEEGTDRFRFDWLSSQTPEFRAEVLRWTRVVERKANTVVTHFGDSPTGLYGVVDGAIGIHVPGHEGRLVLSHILRRGTWFGQTPLFTGRPSTLSFSVIEDARLLFLPMAKALEIVADRPDWTRAFYSVSGFGMEIAIATVVTLQIRNPARRIAATLLRIAPDGEDERPVTVAISQEHLGEIANAARDVVNRALKRFEAEGWISVGYRSVTILRRGDLARHVQSGA